MTIGRKLVDLIPYSLFLPFILLESLGPSLPMKSRSGESIEILIHKFLTEELADLWLEASVTTFAFLK